MSRLDSMIRQQQQEKQETLGKISALTFAVRARLYEKTDNADMKVFSEKARRLREHFFRLVEQLRKQEEYIAYLRKVREEANIKSGVTWKLQQKLALEERIANQRIICQIAKDNTPYSSVESVEMNELKDAAYYKSSFTENSKTCDLSITALTQSDLQELGKNLQDYQAQWRICADELASLNQETFVMVKLFGEKEETLTV